MNSKLLLCLAASLTLAARLHAAPVHVAVCIPPQAGILARIAGDLVVVETLIGPEQNPHTYEPTPRQLVRLTDDRVLFVIGMPFEKALVPRLAQTHPALRVVNTAANYPVLTIVGETHEEAHDPDDADDAPGTPDPHLWLAPRGILHQATLMAAGLVALDPDNAETYRAGLARLTAEVESLDARLRAQFATHQGQTFFAYHPAWGHFAHAYGLRQTAVEQHGGAPGAKYLGGMVDAARQLGVRAILVQSDAEARRVEPLSSALQLRIERLQPLAPDPIASLEATAKAVLNALPLAVATPTP